MPSKICNFVLPAHFAVLLGTLGTAISVLAQVQQVAPGQAEPPVRPDRILAIPKAGRSETARMLHNRNGGKLLKALPHTANIHILEVPAGSYARDLVARYRASGEFELVGLDHYFTPAAAPYDPRVLNGEQWYLNNFGQSGGVTWREIARRGWEEVEADMVGARLDRRLEHVGRGQAADLGGSARHGGLSPATAGLWHSRAGENRGRDLGASTNWTVTLTLSATSPAAIGAGAAWARTESIRYITGEGGE